MKKKVLPTLQKKENKKIKYFWRQDGMDFMASLGGFDRAVVVTYFTPKFPLTEGAYYAIGNRSYFPFTDEQHDAKFDNHFDCIEFAESVILKFVQSLFVDQNKNIQQPLPPDYGDKRQQLPPPFYNKIKFNKTWQK